MFLMKTRGQAKIPICGIKKDQGEDFVEQLKKGEIAGTWEGTARDRGRNIKMIKNSEKYSKVIEKSIIDYVLCLSKARCMLLIMYATQHE